MGKVLLDQAMKLTEVVTGNSGVHVVLGVVIHVPIEKLQGPNEVDRTAAKAEVGNVIA